MRLDFKNKPCPIPVIETRKALENADVNEEFEIVVDNEAAKENIKRLLNSMAQPFELNGFSFVLKRAKELKPTASIPASTDECLFFKSAKIGEGELGAMLSVGFLTAVKERKSVKKLILINDAVLMACDEEHPAHNALKALAQAGVEIICCANCLNYFERQPLIGRAGDAASIIDTLFSHKTLSL